MKPYEIEFSGKVIRVDDTHVIAGDKYFPLQSIISADLSCSSGEEVSREKHNGIGCALLAVAATTIVGIQFGEGFWSCFVLGIIYFLFGLFPAGMIYAYYANMEKFSRKYVYTFRILGKNREVLLALEEQVIICEIKEEAENTPTASPEWLRMIAEINRRIETRHTEIYHNH